MRGPVSSICRFHDHITRAGAALSMVALAVIVVAFALETISRGLFNIPLWWTAELVSYLLCFGIFMTMPYVTGRGAHIAITFVLESMPDQYEKIASKIIILLGVVVCTTMVWITGQETLRQFTNGVQILSVKPIPKWWISIWIIYGFLGSSLYFIRFLFGGQTLPSEGETSEAG